MKKSIGLVALILIVGCTSNYKRPESVEEKMKRYQSRATRVNPVPNYHVSSFRGPSRVPASQAKSGLNDTNKNIYFLSLYEQYEAFKDLYPKYGRDIKHCPVFHQPLISHREIGRKYEWSKKSEQKYMSSPIVSSLKGEGEIEESIREHMDRNHDELVKLCDSGNSDNYYIYENLITLANNSSILKKDASGVNALLKTTLFYNETLLHTIGEKKVKRRSGRSLASSVDRHYYTGEALKRVKALWAKSLYLNK